MMEITLKQKRSNFSLQFIIIWERSQLKAVLLSKLAKFQHIWTVHIQLIFSHHTIQILVIFRFFCFHCLRADNNTLIDLFVFTFIQRNIPCELTDVNIFNGEHRKPKFVAMNPHEEVPILADGSTTVFGGFVSYYCRFFKSNW